MGRRAVAARMSRSAGKVKAKQDARLSGDGALDLAKIDAPPHEDGNDEPEPPGGETDPHSTVVMTARPEEGDTGGRHEG